MSELMTFSAGSILIGVLITLIAACVLIMSVPLLFNRTHTPLSYGIVILFSLILLGCNCAFVGLVRTKEAIKEFQHSQERSLMSKGADLLSAGTEWLEENVSPELAAFASALLDPTDNIDDTLNRKIAQINRYMWTIGISTVLLFFLGIGAAYLTAGGGGSYRRGGGSRRMRPEHRGGERRRRR